MQKNFNHYDLSLAELKVTSEQVTDSHGVLQVVCHLDLTMKEKYQAIRKTLKGEELTLFDTRYAQWSTLVKQEILRACIMSNHEPGEVAFLSDNPAPRYRYNEALPKDDDAFWERYIKSGTLVERFAYRAKDKIDLQPFHTVYLRPVSNDISDHKNDTLPAACTGPMHAHFEQLFPDNHLNEDYLVFPLQLPVVLETHNELRSKSAPERILTNPIPVATFEEIVRIIDICCSRTAQQLVMSARDIEANLSTGHYREKARWQLDKYYESVDRNTLKGAAKN